MTTPALPSIGTGEGALPSGLDFESTARSSYRHGLRAELAVTPWFWPESASADRKYDSLAVHGEVKLREALVRSGVGQPGPPDAQRTALACHVLDLIARVDSPIRSMLEMVRGELMRAIYYEYDPAHDGGGAREPYYDGTPHFRAVYDMRADMASAVRERRELKQDLERAEDRIGKLSDGLMKMRQAHTNQQMETAALQTAKEGLRQDLDRVRENLEQSEQETQYLRVQLSEAIGELNEMSKAKDAEKTIDDLRDRLAKLQEEIMVTMKENNYLKNCVDSMVPKSDHEVVLKEKADVLKTHYNLKQAMKSLQARYDEVLPIAAEYLQRKGSLTPRPDYPHVFEDFDEDELRMRGRSTKEIVSDHADLTRNYKAQLSETRSNMHDVQSELDDLRIFLEGDDRPQKTSLSGGVQFTGRGVGAHVPKYLRFTGKVRNRGFTRRDIEMLMKDVWLQKAEYDKNRPEHADMDSFFYVYLQKRFGIQSMVTEWGYNVVDALERFSEENVRCELFRRVLEGTLCEDILEDQRDFIFSQVRKKLEKIDFMEEGKASGKIKKKSLFNVLPRVFPEMIREDVMTLKKAIHRDHKEKVVAYPLLFEAKSDGSEGNFVSALRRAHLRQIDYFADDLKKALADVEHDANGTVSLLQVRDALFRLDPARMPEEMDEILARATGTADLKDMVPDRRVNPETFVADAVRTSVLRRVYPGWQRTLSKERRQQLAQRPCVCSTWGMLPHGASSRTAAVNAINSFARRIFVEDDAEIEAKRKEQAERAAAAAAARAEAQAAAERAAEAKAARKAARKAKRDARAAGHDEDDADDADSDSTTSSANPKSPRRGKTSARSRAGSAASVASSARGHHARRSTLSQSSTTAMPKPPAPRRGSHHVRRTSSLSKTAKVKHARTSSNGASPVRAKKSASRLAGTM